MSPDNVDLFPSPGANSAAPRVSVITATYNHAPWIGACIESVQRQTYGNWEQIIVDDGSTDEAEAVVRPYLDDPRVSYIRQENRGIWHLADNNNTALAASSGEFVAILEGDDMWPPDKLERQLPIFADESIGMCYGQVQIVDDFGTRITQDFMRTNVWQPPWKSFQDASPIPFLRDLLLLRGNVGAVSLMFRRAALESVGGFFQPPYFPAVDFSTILRVATYHRAMYLEEPLGMWRFHIGQTTDVHNLDYVLGHTRAAVDHFNSLSDEVRAELNITERDIWQARRAYLTNAYWRATRAAMRHREWRKARAYSAEIMRWGGAFRRVEGVAAWLSSLLHVDINSAVDWAAGTLVGKGFVR